MPFPNLATAVKPGEIRNPNGRPKGSRNLSTIVREMGENHIDWSLLPDDSQKLRKKYKHKSAFEAITAVAIAQSINGDSQAREWLRKSGYGEKMDVTTNDESLNLNSSHAQALASDFQQWLQANTQVKPDYVDSITTDTTTTDVVDTTD